MALRSDGFVDIDIHTLESVLSRETLNCKEIYIWNAALRWASAECIRQDLEPTPVNQRQLLGKNREICLYIYARVYVCMCPHPLFIIYKLKIYVAEDMYIYILYTYIFSLYLFYTYMSSATCYIISNLYLHFVRPHK